MGTQRMTFICSGYLHILLNVLHIPKLFESGPTSRIIPRNFPEQKELNAVVSLSPCSVERASHVCKEGAWSRAASQPARAAQRRGHLYRRLDYTHTHTYAHTLSRAHTLNHLLQRYLHLLSEKFSKTLLTLTGTPREKKKKTTTARTYSTLTHLCTYAPRTHTWTHAHTLLHYTQSTLSHNFLWPFLVCLKPLYSS